MGLGRGLLSAGGVGQTEADPASPQGPPGCGLLLFRAGAEASCQKGERVLLTQYLGLPSPGALPPTMHLICTQVSAPSLVLRLASGSPQPASGLTQGHVPGGQASGEEALQCDHGWQVEQSHGRSS